MDIQKLLQYVVDHNASDLHLIVDVAPMVRLDGELVAVPGEKPLDVDSITKLVMPIVASDQHVILTTNKELDFSFAMADRARFRVNAYFQKGTLAASFRLIPAKVPDIDELNLPNICHELAKLNQGFVLVTGPTGQGKSTTLAAIINEINKTRRVHMVTIEDPIEYVYTSDKAIISQREVHNDTHSWDIALKSVLREDPDVVLIGEMRDFETIAAALTIAETGHLVFATLHTNSASQTIDRIVDVFPENQQPQVRLQLSNNLEAVLSQRLLPKITGGRVAAHEILLGTPAIKTSIRDGKSHMIDNIILTSADVGMLTMEHSLAKLVRQGQVSLETAQAYASKPGDLSRFIKGDV